MFSNMNFDEFRPSVYAHALTEYFAVPALFEMFGKSKRSITCGID